MLLVHQPPNARTDFFIFKLFLHMFNGLLTEKSFG